MLLDQKLQKISHLTVGQRYTIEVLDKEGYKQSEIAKKIGKDKSVINREMKRNCDQRSGAYKAELAERKRANRHKQKKTQGTVLLKKEVYA